MIHGVVNALQLILGFCLKSSSVSKGNLHTKGEGVIGQFKGLIATYLFFMFDQ